jgi:menaquinone-dependent protoporphyrinogen oxidase
MQTAIIFATVEGHTGKICRFVRMVLEQANHAPAVFDAESLRPVSLEGMDNVILIAPVHERRHPDHFEATLTALAEPLAKRPTLMLSVSLSAAFPEGREEAQDYLDEMKMRTGSSPTREALVAGAVKLDRYDYFAEQVVKLVVLRDKAYVPSQGSHEFTDWTKLRDTVESFVGQSAAVA